jgi:hypothetical protein
MAMRLCDNGGPAVRKCGDLDGAVNGPARRRRKKFSTSLLSGRRCDTVTGQSQGLFFAPTFRIMDMNKTQNTVVL